MADKINRSPLPTDLNTTSNSNSVLPPPSASLSSPASISSSPSSAAASTQSCSCSKIVIMQLFHEMKQDFPTIPDHIVNKYVTNNCHNRDACIESLRQESEEYPGSVNPYPQALRNQNNKKANMHLIRKTTAILSTPSNAKSAENNITNEKNKENDQATGQRKPLTPSPQRPNTLSLKSLDSCRPTRMAPPVPPSATGPISNETASVESSSHGLNKTPLNVSLNVIVSPVSGRPPVRPPRSTPNTLNPTESGYSHHHHRSPQASSPRNIASLSFTLHQPSSSSGNQQNGTQGADDANGPSLTYASSSYDAQTGYQSRLEIVVAGNNGNGEVNVIDSGRQKSNMAVIDTRNEHVQSSGSVNQPSRSGSSSIPNVVATPEFLEEG